MKWTAFILLVLNLVIWWLPQWAGAQSGVSGPGGALPRVASLKSSEAPPETLPEARACVRAGWFDGGAEARAAGELVDVPFSVYEQQVEQAPLHWVLIRPQPEADARAQHQALMAEGVESYVVASGEHQNAISLGLFKSREAAEAVLAEKKQDNLDVVLAKFPRNRIGYGLVLEVESGQETELVQSVEAEIGKKFEFIESSTCKGVATSKENP
ncbi:MAG TPA: hypothetical protein VKY53_03985 [Marinobacter sp.]|nr:hypothetical protein [Marinobacter sp.]